MKKKRVKEKIKTTKIDPDAWNDRFGQQHIKQKVALADLLKRPEISIDEIEYFIEEKTDNREIKYGVEADIKYSGFIENERDEIEKYRKMENSNIPETINYEKINGLLNETRTKLKTIKPRSLGQAARIPGVTPADISVIMVYLSKNKHVSRGTVDV